MNTICVYGINFNFIYMILTEAVVQRCSVKQGVLENFAKFIGKHLCQSLSLNEVAGLCPIKTQDILQERAHVRRMA